MDFPLSHLRILSDPAKPELVIALDNG